MFNTTLIWEDILSIIVSIICGSLLGYEREYQNKTAGFRTIILITLGAAVFTLVSRYSIGESDDRIASTIVTGIGFIGAGVIFKNSLSVKGLTTAAVIWVSAAIGMMSAMGHHLLSILLSIAVLFILSGFYRIEQYLYSFHYRKQFTITFSSTELQHLHTLEENIIMRGLKVSRLKVFKEDTLKVVIDVSGNKNKIMNFNELMVNIPEIKSFEIME